MHFVERVPRPEKIICGGSPPWDQIPSRNSSNDEATKALAETIRKKRVELARRDALGLPDPPGIEKEVEEWIGKGVFYGVEVMREGNTFERIDEDRDWSKVGEVQYSFSPVNPLISYFEGGIDAVMLSTWTTGARHRAKSGGWTY